MENNLLIPDSESLGSMLRHARELRGISLEEVATATHVRLTYLRAIEQNHLDQLPGLVFLKGYVRAYVNYVGLNPDEVMMTLENFIAPREKVDSHFQKRSLKYIVLVGLIIIFIFVMGWIFGKYL